MKACIRTFVFLLIVYSIGLLAGILFLGMQLAGRVKVMGRLRLPNKRGMLLVSNHPSLFEPILLPFHLFFPRFLLNPFRYFPWNTPARDWYNKRHFFLFRFLRTIPIDRMNGGPVPFHRIKETLRRLREILRKGEVVIIFPEGGRTFKRPKRLISKTGKELGELKRGVEVIVQSADCDVIPLWLDNTDKVFPPGSWFPRLKYWLYYFSVIIKIGKPLKGEITVERLQQELLDLADN